MLHYVPERYKHTLFVLKCCKRGYINRRSIYKIHEHFYFPFSFVYWLKTNFCWHKISTFGLGHIAISYRSLMGLEMQQNKIHKYMDSRDMNKQQGYFSQTLFNKGFSTTKSKKHLFQNCGSTNQSFLSEPPKLSFFKFIYREHVWQSKTSYYKNNNFETLKSVIL